MNIDIGRPRRDRLAGWLFGGTADARYLSLPTPVATGTNQRTQQTLGWCTHTIQPGDDGGAPTATGLLVSTDSARTVRSQDDQTPESTATLR
jgi:hypothetical protein